MTQNRDHLDLATLFAGNDDGPFPEYWDRRKDVIYDVLAYLDGNLRDDLPEGTAKRIAEKFMSDAESCGGIVGDDVTGEIPARYTASGNPLPLSI